MESQIRLRLKDTVKKIATAIESGSRAEIKLHGALFRIVLKMPQKVVKIAAEVEMLGHEKPSIEESIEISLKDVSTIDINAYGGSSTLFACPGQLLYIVIVSHSIYVDARWYDKQLKIDVSPA